MSLTHEVRAEAQSGGKGWHVGRWGRAGSKDRVWGGTPPGASQGIDAESGWKAVGPGQLAAPMGRRLSPKGKKEAESFVSKSLLGGTRASSYWEGNPDKEKALAEFNLILGPWSLSSYPVPIPEGPSPPCP